MKRKVVTSSTNGREPSRTEATDGVAVVLSLQLDAGLFWMTLLVVAQPVTLDSRRFRGSLPAGHNGGAVKWLELKNRS